MEVLWNLIWKVLFLTQQFQPVNKLIDESSFCKDQEVQQREPLRGHREGPRGQSVRSS